MAEAALFSIALFSIATDILKSLAAKIAKPGGSKILLLCSAKDELRSLKDTVKSIQAVLLAAKKQQCHNNQVKGWVGRLKDMLYEAQDLLDDVATEDLRRKVTPGNKMLKALDEEILGISVIRASMRPLMPAFESSLTLSYLSLLESEAKSVVGIVSLSLSLYSSSILL